MFNLRGPTRYGERNVSKQKEFWASAYFKRLNCVSDKKCLFVLGAWLLLWNFVSLDHSGKMKTTQGH